MDKTTKLELTGNPFVDTGLGVIAILANLDNIDELNINHLKSVYIDNGDQGEKLAYWNSKLKAFTQIFGTNNPLYQTAYGYKQGKGPSKDNFSIYKSTLKGFLDEIGNSKPGQSGRRCWACGTPSNFNFEKVCINAVKNAVKAVKDKDKNQRKKEKSIGRDWFPLAGSIGNDAQNLPAASISPHICPKCLFAVHYLTLGVMLLDNRLVVFQSSFVNFWYELLQDIVNEVKKRIQAGKYEPIGQKEGNVAFMRRLLILFDRLQTKKKWCGIPTGTNLYVWRFSNSGKNPDCQIEEIPNPALEFLWKAVRHGLHAEIEQLISSEGKDPQYSLFRCISEKREYPNLYPEGKKTGASSKLFFLYQENILKRSGKSLQVAYKVAKRVSEKVDKKEFKRLQRKEAFGERRLRNKIRSFFIQMAESGELTLEDYLELFPLKEGNGIIIKEDGWNIIRFYLHHTKDEDEPAKISESLKEPQNLHCPKDEDKLIVNGASYKEIKIKRIFYYAATIYNHYIKEKGKEQLKEVLQQMRMEKINAILWLKRQFVQLAKESDGFTYRDWSTLCKLDNGRFFVSELLFQMRLLWAQWLYENKNIINSDYTPISEYDCELPDRIQIILNNFFQKYVIQRGIERFHRDILSRIHKQEIGLSWFKECLTKQCFENILPITEEEWEDFLLDDDGNSIKYERLFQLHLFLTNLYKKYKCR